MSNRDSKFWIHTHILNEMNNPFTWVPWDQHEPQVIGYALRQQETKFGVVSNNLTLYLMNPEFIPADTRLYQVEDLQRVCQQYHEEITKDNKIVMFRNPPITLWMDTKDNWIKKLANRLSGKYNKPFDEMVSQVHYAIMKCYSKNHVYIGNLGYIERTAENLVKGEHRYLKNRMHGGHPAAQSLDQELPSDEGVTLFHDLIGKLDPEHAEADLADLQADITAALRETFSDREIHQILNAPGYLAMPLYRKLNKWRKDNKKEDFQ